MKSRKQYLKEADKQLKEMRLNRDLYHFHGNLVSNMKKLKTILEASRFEMTPDKKKKELVRLRQEFSAYKTSNKGIKGRADRFENDAESVLNKLMSGKSVSRSEIDKLDDHVTYVAKMAKLLVDSMERVLDGIEDSVDA